MKFCGFFFYLILHNDCMVIQGQQLHDRLAQEYHKYQPLFDVDQHIDPKHLNKILIEHFAHLLVYQLL